MKVKVSLLLLAVGLGLVRFARRREPISRAESARPASPLRELAFGEWMPVKSLYPGCTRNPKWQKEQIGYWRELGIGPEFGGRTVRHLAGVVNQRSPATRRYVDRCLFQSRPNQPSRRLQGRGRRVSDSLQTDG